jgi:Tfp pilus assembly protein PilW
MNLISILMGLGLSIILIASATQWVMIAKKTFQQYQQQALYLDIGQSALQYFLRDIHASGYRGPRSQDASFPLNKIVSEFSKDKAYLRFDRSVYGFFSSPGSCYKKMPEVSCKRVKENSPVLIIYNVAQKMNVMLQAAKSSEENLRLSPNHGIHQGALVLIADGYQGDLFIANLVQGSVIHHDKMLNVNQSANFSKVYSAAAEVVELQTVAYYLGTPERFQKNNPANRKNVSYALFRDDFLQNAQEIMAGVSDVEFEYSLQDPESGEIRYQKAQYISERDWPLVRSLRVFLSMEDKKNWAFEVAIRNRISPPINFGYANHRILAWNSHGNARHALISKNE